MEGVGEGVGGGITVWGPQTAGIRYRELLSYLMYFNVSQKDGDYMDKWSERSESAVGKK